MNKYIAWIRRGTALLTAVIAAVCLLSACGVLSGDKEELPADGPRIYYVNSAGTGLICKPIDIQDDGDAGISDMFLALRDGEFADGESAVSKNLELDHTAWQEKSLVLYLKGNYPVVGTMAETLLRAALAKSMLSFADADSVVINVNDVPLMNEYGAEVGAIRAEDFITDIQAAGGTENVPMVLYFADPKEPVLVKEIRDTEIEADYDTVDLARLALDLLLRGPESKALRNVIPSGTEVLDMSITERVCYVNLSDTFANSERDYSCRLSVYSIVDTLCEIEGIEKVQLTVNGNADIVLEEGLTINAPLEADKDMIK